MLWDIADWIMTFAYLFNQKLLVMAISSNRIYFFQLFTTVPAKHISPLPLLQKSNIIIQSVTPHDAYLFGCLLLCLTFYISFLYLCFLKYFIFIFFRFFWICSFGNMYLHFRATVSKVAMNH